MAAQRGADVTSVPISEAVASLKTVPPELFEQASAFFG
jgi:6-phosphofructokinase 1